MALLGTRITATALALATGITFITPHAAVAATPPTGSELQTTGDFLATQLRETTDGLLSGPTGRADVGLTADVIFALDALGVQDNQADRSYTAVLDNAAGFMYFDGEVDAGRLAKIVTLQSSRGERTDTYVAELVDAVQEDGRMMNETAGEPTSPVQNFSQAWSVIALARAGEVDAAEKAAGFLESQICPDGGVPLFQAVPPRCTSVDPDTTGLAGQALTLTRGVDATSTESVLGYLRTNMSEDGGINSRYAGVNANTTALAAGAFAAAGELDSFAHTHAYLDSVRFGDDAPDSLQGAFAWRTRDMDSITAPTDQIRRTSAQAALGYAGGSYASSDTLYPEQVETPAPTPTPSEPADSSSGSSEGGLFLGVLAAVAAVIAAVIGFASPAAFLPPQL